MGCAFVFFDTYIGQDLRPFVTVILSYLATHPFCNYRQQSQFLSEDMMYHQIMESYTKNLTICHIIIYRSHL